MVQHLALAGLLSSALATIVHDNSLCIGPENTYPANYFEMDFFRSNMTVSNLGGLGGEFRGAGKRGKTGKTEKKL